MKKLKTFIFTLSLIALGGFLKPIANSCNESTYTWYNSKAKRMLYSGVSIMHNSFGYKNLVYHKFTEMEHANYGWNHYHPGIYYSDMEESLKFPYGDPLHDIHGFFGLMYVWLDEYKDDCITYPEGY